jgi:hypothetical protein
VTRTRHDEFHFLMWLLLLAGIIALLLARTARGEQCPCPSGQCPTPSILQAWRAQASPQYPAIVQVVEKMGGGKTGLCSGVIIDPEQDTGGKLAFVFTAAHAVHGTMSVIVNGREYGAKLEATDEAADMALLSIANPHVQAYTLANAIPASGTPVVVAGYPRGQYGTVAGQIISTDPSGYVDVTAQVTEGYSGGPVVDSEGDVVALLTWRRVSNQATSPGAGPHCLTLRRLLRRVMLARSLPIPDPCTTTTPPDVAGETPPSTVPIEPIDPCQPLTVKLAAIDDRVSLLEQKPTLAGERGEKGEKGEPGLIGPIGPAGPPGKDATQQQFVLRVRLKDKKTGTVLKEGSVKVFAANEDEAKQAGDVLVFRLVPK